VSEEIVVKVQLPVAPLRTSERWLALIYDQKRSLVAQRMLTHREKMIIKFKGIKIYCNAKKTRSGDGWTITSIAGDQLRKW